MSKIIKIVFALIILSIISLGLYLGLTRNNKTTDSQKLKIITTIFPLYDIAKHIGGDFVEVSSIIPAGVEAHSYEPTPSDILSIKNSDIFMYAGDTMEPWAQEVLEGIDKTDNVFNASIDIEAPEDLDPHYWMDFTNMIKMARRFTDQLISTNPTNKATYQTNLSTYISSLEDIDKQYIDTLATCTSKKIVFAGHYAFGYMSKRYGYTYESAYGISPDSEPSAQDIAGLIEQIKNDSIKYVYYEEMLSPRVAQTLSEETGTQLLELNPAHNLTEEQYTNNTTFISLMESNLENLKIGLQCK